MLQRLEVGRSKTGGGGADGRNRLGFGGRGCRLGALRLRRRLRLDSRRRGSRNRRSGNHRIAAFGRLLGDAKMLVKLHLLLGEELRVEL